VRLRRSQRTRVIAACTVFFVGTSFVLGVALPRSFEAVAREDLRERTLGLARAAAALRDRARGAPLGELGPWLATEPDFESVALLDAQGSVLSKWPDVAHWESTVSLDAPVAESVEHFVATVPIADRGDGARLALRTTTERLRGELSSVAALFLALVLLAAASLVALAGFLVRAVLAPIERIREAAERLAEGELIADIPRSGDPEIDELGELISQLGDERRRAARGREVPLLVPRYDPETASPQGSERRRGDRRRPRDPTE